MVDEYKKFLKEIEKWINNNLSTFYCYKYSDKDEIKYVIYPNEGQYKDKEISIGIKRNLELELICEGIYKVKIKNKKELKNILNNLYDYIEILKL